MEEWFAGFWSKYHATLITMGYALLIAIGFFLLGTFIQRVGEPWLRKRLDPQKHAVASTLLDSFALPISLFLKICGICIGLLLIFASFPSNSPEFLLFLQKDAPKFLYSLLRIVSIVTAAWGLVRSSNTHSLLLRKVRRKYNMKIGRSFTRFLSAIFNAVVIAFATVMVVTELGYDVSALITGLGLGGLTFALAGKDSAANFFGGLILVTERPFEIGDWISVEGVEGTVEDITLRSTKIRTGPGSLTTVPNSTLSNAAITNWSGGMEKRQTKFKISLLRGTPEDKLRKYLEAIRTMLQTDPEIQTDSVLVSFADLAESSLDISIIYYSSLPGYRDFLRIKERVNFNLISLAEQHGVEFAFPSRTLYVNN